MKKHDAILKRVEQLEQKYGILYAGPDGRLFKGLRVFYTVCFAYTMGINMLYLLGMWLSETVSGAAWNAVISVIICTVLMILGFVLLYTPFRIGGMISGALSATYMLAVFAPLLEDSLGLWGHKTSFYWRHLAPLALMILLSAFMLIILLRYTVKRNRAYNRVVENLYLRYHVGDGHISDEQWDEFLSSYDPRTANTNSK